MADEFDPDAFLAAPAVPAAISGGGGEAFDPDAFLASPTAAPSHRGFGSYDPLVSAIPFVGPALTEPGQEAATAVGESLRGQISGALKGYGAGYTQLAREQATLQRPIAPGEDATPEERAAYRTSRFVRGTRMTPETEAMRAQQWSEQGARPVTEHPLYQAGEYVSEIGKTPGGVDYLGPGPGWEGSWTRDIASGATSVLTNIALSRVNPGLAPLFYVPGGAGEQLDRALKSGATEEQAIAAAGTGAAAATTNMVDTMLPFFGGSTGKVLGFLNKVGVERAARIFAGGSAEAIQEGVEDLINNAYAQGTYNPEQDIMQDVPRSMAVAFIVGAGTTAGFSGRRAGEIPEQVTVPAEQPPQPPRTMVPRENVGISLLPPEMPHMAAPAVDPLAARRSAGAAALPGGPLADVSPETIAKVKDILDQEGFTPYTLEQRLEEMSQHEFLGELSPNTSWALQGLYASGGQGRNEIGSSVRTRAKEAQERMNEAFNQAFGEPENRFEFKRILEIQRNKESHPFWSTFKSTPVPPTPTLTALQPRLDASGAWKAAEQALKVEGIPTENQFLYVPGPRPNQPGQHIALAPNITSGTQQPTIKVPSAAFYQAAKESLDKAIEKSMAAPGGENDARRYTALKNDLITAIDQHPDNRVAGLWKQAREVYARPTELIKARQFGERVLTGHIHPDELPFMTASFSPLELRAMNLGIRGDLKNRVGRPGKTENAVINTILAGNNQEKIRWAIGDEAADRLIGAVEHEQRMHLAPNTIMHGSPTEGRRQATKLWGPPPGMMEDLTVGKAVGALVHPLRTAAVVAGKLGISKMAERQEREHARIRDEAARIMTLQGPERDAVLRYLVNGPEGGATGPMTPPAGPQGPTGPVPAGPPAAGGPETINEPLRRNVTEYGTRGGRRRRILSEEPLKIGQGIEEKILEAGYQRAVAPTFHSGIAKALEGIKQEKAAPNQWLATLANRPGVKPEEMKWLGLEDWLNQQKGPVTKAQVQDFIRANQIEVREVEKGVAPDLEIKAKEIALSQGHPSWEDISVVDRRRYVQLAAGRRLTEQAPSEPKFSQYQLPGGENYRELLLTLPTRNQDEADRITEIGQRLNKIQAHFDAMYGMESPAADARRAALVSEEAALRTEQRALATKDNSAISQQFKSSHWDEPNVLAHIRFNDRTIDGKKTLFIEEIQSDWHQKGKRKGYDQKPITQDANLVAKEIEPGWLEVSTADGRFVTNVTDPGATPDSAVAEARRRLRTEPQRTHLADTVPDAPFKTTWPELSLKRMIRYAAENGYDQVAWTPGSVQADRYDLSKQVSRIDYERTSDGKYELHAYDLNGERVFEEDEIPISRVEEVVGKDIAKKIEDDVGKRTGGPYREWRQLTGLDLKVGGEGMSGFYDKILPAAANKLVKKYGVKVGEGKVETAPRKERFVVRDATDQGEGEIVEAFATRAQAQRFADDFGGGVEVVEQSTGKQPVHTLPISPGLRRAALISGFSQFSSGGAVYRANGGRVNGDNIETNPTEAQKEAGNYAKDHVNIHGLSIAIENAKGHLRSGVDKDGKPWSVKMPAHYGYIKGTVGKDKDHVDVYLGPHRMSALVFVIDQMNAETKRFDEHKAFIGFASKGQVINTYRKAFSDGRADERLGAMHQMTIDQFKRWLKHGDTTKPIYYGTRQ